MELLEEEFKTKAQLSVGGSRTTIEKVETKNGSAPRATLDMEELTFSETKGELIFLTKVFKDGTLMGFWSHSPWGTCHDKEQGWALVNPETMTILDSFATLEDGVRQGGFKDWFADLKVDHGKANFLVNEWGDRVWKITEV